MSREREFSFYYLLPARNEEAVTERLKILTGYFKDKPAEWVKIAEVISRMAGDMGLSNHRVIYLTNETYKVLYE